MLFDTAVFVYAVGSDHPHRQPCRRLVELAASEAVLPDVSIEAVQEYVQVRTRRGVERTQAVDEGRSIVALCRVHDLDQPVLQVALQLFRTHHGLGARDAIHAATALACQAEAIVSPDHDFDGIPGFRRFDPRVAVKILESAQERG